MAKYCGDQFLLQLDTGGAVFVTVGGCRSNSLTINKETVDVTTKGDTPWMQHLASCGIISMSLSASGVFTDDAQAIELMTTVLTGSGQSNMKIISAHGDTFVGVFSITSFERTGEYNGEEQFSVSLESAGEITYTAAP